MDSVIRGLVVYLFLLIVFRISGKRTLSQATSFDLVLLLIISETTQEAMIDGDHSVINGFLLIITLVSLSVLFSILKQKSVGFEKAMDSTPVLIFENGKILKDRMDRERVDEADILDAARRQEGIERLDQIKFAILEREGEISIVPKKQMR